MKTTVVFLLITVSTFAQKYTDTAVFENGVTIPYFNYSLLHQPPKHNVSLSPFTVFFIGNGVGLGFAGNYLYRMNDDMLIDAKFWTSYSKETEDMSLPDFNKRSMEAGANFSYKIGQHDKTHRNHIYIASRYSNVPGYDLDNYKVDFDMPYATNFYVTGGLNFLRAAHTGDRLGVSDTINFSNMMLGNSSSVALNVGLTRDRYTYQVFSSPELHKERYRYYRVRNYLYLTYSPYVGYNVLGYNTQDQTYRETKSGFIAPSHIRRIGWRFGAEVKMGSHFFHNLMYFGMEMGRVQGFIVDSYTEMGKEQSSYVSGSIYFMFKMGYEFGTKNYSFKKTP